MIPTLGQHSSSLARRTLRDGCATSAALDTHHIERYRKQLRGSLLERVAQGDDVAVQECIDRYGGLVHSLARRMSTTPADADDAAQEVFIDLWKQAHRYREELGAETTFVAMITRRRLIDRWRTNRRRPQPESLLGAEAAVTPLPPDELETADDAAYALAALHQLDEKPRQVIRMSIVDGLTHEAIAEKLQMPLGTVKTLIRRGLQKVRETLSRAQAQNPRRSKS